MEAGRRRKKVREVGEKSEVAGSSDQCQGPWEIKQNKKWQKTSGFVWKDTTDNFPMVILPKYYSGCWLSNSSQDWENVWWEKMTKTTHLMSYREKEAT